MIEIVILKDFMIFSLANYLICDRRVDKKFRDPDLHLKIKNSNKRLQQYSVNNGVF